MKKFIQILMITMTASALMIAVHCGEKEKAADNNAPEQEVAAEAEVEAAAEAPKSDKVTATVVDVRQRAERTLVDFQIKTDAGTQWIYIGKKDPIVNAGFTKQNVLNKTMVFQLKDGDFGDGVTVRAVVIEYNGKTYDKSSFK